MTPLLAMAVLACPAKAALPVGLAVPLVTTQALSSKVQVKGDMVALATDADVVVDGAVVIPRGTAVVGEIADARKKGAMGMAGRLDVQPLYLTLDGVTVRLAGAAREKGSVPAGSVIGMALLTPAFTGRSATIPAGSALGAIVDRPATVRVVRCLS